MLLYPNGQRNRSLSEELADGDQGSQPCGEADTIKGNLKNRTVLVLIQSGVPMSRDTQAEREQLAKLSGRVTGAGVRISLPRPYDNTEWCSGKHVWLITKRSGVRIPSP